MLARLTVWQAEHLYLMPAHERAERLRVEAGGAPAKPEPHDWDELPQRDEFVAGMCEQFGGEPETWGKQWDAMKAAREE